MTDGGDGKAPLLKGKAALRILNNTPAEEAAAAVPGTPTADPFAPGGMGRRDALKILGASAAAGAVASQPSCAPGVVEAFFQQHYLKMTPEEVQATIERLEKRYAEKLGQPVTVGNAPPIPGTVYGYAINVSRCQGHRDCVTACMRENNQSRDPEIQYIRVLELDHGTMNLETSNHYYEGPVPKDGKFYLPVQCMQCDNPPCVSACPIEATWTEPDGIVVIDYDWCIGCRYCMTACPYWARHFNWSEPQLPPAEVNKKTHYLSNRPRPKGVVEKCTFCLQRTREGQQPACVEACPTGARVFGNLLDPKSEIRWILANKVVFRLKEELNTEPKLWYYSD